MTVCTRPEQTQTKQNPITGVEGWHEIPPPAGGIALHLTAAGEGVSFFKGVIPAGRLTIHTPGQA